MSELILGIDDAGRGPVIGPIVLGGCLLLKEDEQKLKALGVKDSKMLTAAKREELAEKIKEIAKDYETKIFTAEEINEMMNSKINLNTIEAIAAAQIITRIRRKNPGKPIKIVLDCPSTNKNAWLTKVREFIEGSARGLAFLCEHKADVNHVAVSAASILAKVKRDEEIEKLKKEIGMNFGSGYPHDPVTVEFIKKHYHDHKDKKIFREHWMTLKNILGIDTKKQAIDRHRKKEKQKKLFEN
ncbi:ribonuclease HII [Candidatus Pacearchaeota archaeon]|nr:ribonuclease HII [Candidatus Pacearchaeota archaeon]